MTLPPADVRVVNYLARHYARDNDMAALERVREMLATCLSEEERYQVTYWWHEGCRDYAGDMERLAQLEADLIS